ncbi:MAG: ATP-dependent DNA ligase, partial [Candidatus Thorarchaeota archaeon]
MLEPTNLERVRDPKAAREAEQSKKEDKIEPLRFFIPLKGYRAYYKFAELVPEVVQTWFKPEDYPIGVQKKYDGVRLVLMKQGNKIIIRTDDGEDATDRFPQICEIARKTLPHTVTLDIESELWINKKHRPREEIAGYIHEQTKPDDVCVVFNVFDCVYFWDEKVEHHELKGTIGDLHKYPYELRYRYLQSIDFQQSTDDVPKTPGFNLTPTIIAKDSRELIKAIKKCSDAIASEGAVVKSMTSPYLLTGLTDKWLKFKKMAEIHAIILDQWETKTKGVYTLLLGVRIPKGWKVPKKRIFELKGKQYMILCRTFNVKGKKPIGGICSLMFHTLNHYIDEETGEQWIAAYEPKFIDMRPKQTVPDDAVECIKIAHDKELLQVKRLQRGAIFPMDDKPHRAVLQN